MPLAERAHQLEREKGIRAAAAERVQVKASSDNIAARRDRGG